MARTFFAVGQRNNMLGSTGLLPGLSSGKVLVYGGTQPADADTAITSQTLLGTLSLAVTAGVVSAGVLTMNAIASVAAAAGGVANFIRQLQSDSATKVLDTNVCNQTVTLSGAVSVNDTIANCSALAQPLFAGQDLWFVDAASGVLKKISVAGVAPAQAAAAGATTFPCTAAATAIANASASSAGAIINAPYIQPNATIAVSAYTITAPAAGT